MVELTCGLKPRSSDPSRPAAWGCIAAFRFSIRILPGAALDRHCFLRTDLDNFPIPASWRHVARVSYATSLMRQGVLISTTEHFLSVFYCMGIDNAYVEIDNLEVPILDGSGLPFVELIRAGWHPALPPPAALSAHQAAGFGRG